MTKPITTEEIFEYVFTDKHIGQHIQRTITFYGIDFTFHLSPCIVSSGQMSSWWTIEKPELSEESKVQLISIINS